MPTPNELLEIATTVARRAAALALQRRRDGVEVAASKSSITDIVTRADRESEDLIRSALEASRPRDGFLGEESGGDAGSSGLTWVVDPIDGTVNYFYDIPAWAVSVAVVEGDPDPASWRTLAGAVVNPVTGEVFTAAAGGGARLNGRPIQVNGGVELPLALVGTGFGYDAEIRRKQAAFVAELIPQVRDIRRIGAASLDLCSVACGRLDAYYERGLNPWDHAAGALIAQEAGARVGGLRDTPAGKALLLAAAPGLFEQLDPLVQGYYQRWE
jgi:myo-inositol-1(or 4)-monophosphatase